MPQIDAPCGSDRVSTLVVTGDLVGGEKSPVNAAVAVVKRGRLGMTGGTPLSVSGCFENRIFLISEINE